MFKIIQTLLWVVSQRSYFLFTQRETGEGLASIITQPRRPPLLFTFWLSRRVVSPKSCLQDHGWLKSDKIRLLSRMSSLLKPPRVSLYINIWMSSKVFLLSVLVIYCKATCYVWITFYILPFCVQWSTKWFQRESSYVFFSPLYNTSNFWHRPLLISFLVTLLWLQCFPCPCSVQIEIPLFGGLMDLGQAVSKLGEF